ncbi:hypothetical protein ABZU94_37135 [Streptomyces mirabilis]|uniref:hypothetical protein n=1 Tax=Streptomyces sp. NPDC005388 TaxID=3156717 RepID=UPI000EB08C93|nr:hypothetical protein BX286_6265 [Streptomyces sp. 3211.6]
MPVPVDVPEPQDGAQPPPAPPAGEANRGTAADEPAATAPPVLSPSELTSLQRKLQAKYH